MKYKYDTHVHTSEVSGCGKVEAAEVVKLYKQAGYTGIIITDHFHKGFFDKSSEKSWKGKVDNYLAGYKRALKEGNKIDLQVFLGIELRFEDSANDYLVYGLDEKFLLDNPHLYRTNLKDFRKLANKAGLLIYQAHPFRGECTPANPTLLDGLEYYNGHPGHSSRNDLATEFGLANNLRPISGSDFHQIPHLARGGLLLMEKVTSLEELILVLKDETKFELIRSDGPSKPKF